MKNNATFSSDMQFPESESPLLVCSLEYSTVTLAQHGGGPVLLFERKPREPGRAMLTWHAGFFEELYPNRYMKDFPGGDAVAAIRVNPGAPLHIWWRQYLESSGANDGLEATLLLLARQISEVARQLAQIHNRRSLLLILSVETIYVSGDSDALILLNLDHLTEIGSPATDSHKIPYKTNLHPFLYSRAGNAGSGIDWAGIRNPLRIDIFALGQTIIQVLSIILENIGNDALESYAFGYLHLMACRMLDGQNTERQADKTHGLPEIWNDLRTAELAQISYDDAGQIAADISKLIQPHEFLSSIPELSEVPTHGMHVAPEQTAVLTTRVRRVIEHPIFVRLQNVPQLELMNTIYPSCRHTRFEHSIGVYANACQMVRRLFVDPYNPLFRQLISKEDAAAVLAAALLHDLGQYPFGHTLDSVFPELRHEQYSIALLDHEITDAQGATLADILRSASLWNIDLVAIKELLSFTPVSLFDNNHLKRGMLQSVINGPIDADKLDYLLRDSRACGLNYGEGIDRSRLIQSMTIASRRDTDGSLKLSIGVYEKGKIAAESLTFARYLLYQSVYWHHSSRALRCMVVEAVRRARARWAKPADFVRKLEKLLMHEDYMMELRVEQVLDFLSGQTDNHGTRLISMVRARRYYRLLIQIGVNAEGIDRSRFHQAAGNLQFIDLLQGHIHGKVIRYIQRAPDTDNESVHERLLKLAQSIMEPSAIICDSPKASLGADAKLQIMPEPKKIFRTFRERRDLGAQISDVWLGVHSNLMAIAASGAVFCHPDLYDLIMAAVGREGLLGIVAETLSQYDR